VLGREGKTVTRKMGKREHRSTNWKGKDPKKEKVAPGDIKYCHKKGKKEKGNGLKGKVFQPTLL